MPENQKEILKNRQSIFYLPSSGSHFCFQKMSLKDHYSLSPGEYGNENLWLMISFLFYAARGNKPKVKKCIGFDKFLAICQTAIHHVDRLRNFTAAIGCSDQKIYILLENFSVTLTKTLVCKSTAKVKFSWISMFFMY